jgi:hypothetical protein
MNMVAKMNVAHGSEMLHVTLVGNVKVKLRIGSKMHKTIKVSDTRTLNKSRSGKSVNETCLLFSTDRCCDRIQRHVKLTVGSIIKTVSAIKK